MGSEEARAATYEQQENTKHTTTDSRHGVCARRTLSIFEHLPYHKSIFGRHHDTGPMGVDGGIVVEYSSTREHKSGGCLRPIPVVFESPFSMRCALELQILALFNHYRTCYTGTDSL